ncbi:hypothetical protein C8J27_10491 [Rhodobacter aestuarii]|uniref:PASTA domain-containing protein n=1 Tax=Rhodobacter aestuarii TaxID=453582 RepID=A0A1N7L1E6_9RHOB|nr:PASTA domain-containing protein [Rhodobacter aestuarii]PTV95455.1 hypothetical protein C8J27_10491 [Rhodobacter aestuarii]SIS67460.1 hypothetical protein SAMN05421580_103163 [Rhodobacter aestuarii]
MSDLKSLVTDVVAAPLGDVIASVGRGVAEAQQALDEGSLATVLEIYTESDDAKLQLLQEIGYRPTFYTIPEATGEVKVSLTMGTGAAGTPVTSTVGTAKATSKRAALPTKRETQVYATPVDAAYANRFGYQASISATLSFKIVPVPAPEGADELRQMPDLMHDAEGNLAPRTGAQAIATLAKLGLETVFVDKTGQEVSDPDLAKKISGQDTEPGAILRLGDRVQVKV